MLFLHGLVVGLFYRNPTVMFWLLIGLTAMMTIGGGGGNKKHKFKKSQYVDTYGRRKNRY